MGRSNDLFGRLTDLQSDAASSIGRILRSHDDTKKGLVVSTLKETYKVKLKPSGKTILSIDDGMDNLTELKIHPEELIGILETLEEKYFD